MRRLRHGQEPANRAARLGHRGIQGSPYELGRGSGRSEEFDAALQVGYHAMRHTHAGVLGHAYTYAIDGLRMKGTLIGEPGLVAALAGRLDVPLVFISGDSHAVGQARSLVNRIVGVSTEVGVGLYGARSLTPWKAQALIWKGAKEAMSKIGRLRPVKLKKPVTWMWSS